MRDTIVRHLIKIGAANDRETMATILQSSAAKVNTGAINSAGLVIKAGASTLAKTGAADCYLTVGGILVKIAAATDMLALTGLTITAAKFNVACFFIDAAGAPSVLFGTEGASIATLKWPDFPINKALVGILLITHSSTFTGGTTFLDTATTVYLSPTIGFDPTFLFS